MTTSTLIADSGSTKTDWLLRLGQRALRFQTIGLNPNYLVREQIVDTLRKEVVTAFEKSVPERIEFYGAGCGTPGGRQLMVEMLLEMFPEAAITVGSDLELAARALFGTGSGAAVILGTGTACGYYAGEKLIATTPSLGYVLGDEGSGSHLGRSLLQHYFYRKLSPHHEAWITERLPGGKDELIERLYRRPGAGTYLASWAREVIERKADAEMRSIIRNCIDLFIDHQIRPLQLPEGTEVGFVGSVGFYLREEISTTLRAEGLRPVRFLQHPLDGFVT